MSYPKRIGVPLFTSGKLSIISIFTESGWALVINDVWCFVKLTVFLECQTSMQKLFHYHSKATVVGCMIFGADEDVIHMADYSLFVSQNGWHSFVEDFIGWTNPKREDEYCELLRLLLQSCQIMWVFVG